MKDYNSQPYDTTSRPDQLSMPSPSVSLSLPSASMTSTSLPNSPPPSPPAEVSQAQLEAKAREIMKAHWRYGTSDLGRGSNSATPAQTWGYTDPNPQRYGWQWLWDSCFHAVVWAELGEADRALLELQTLLATMGPSGFVPHMNFVSNPSASLDFWGRSGASSITQPPMFGHAIAELVRRGIEVPEELCTQAARALSFFVKHRRDSSTGLIAIVHPWESGADNSPRWDGHYLTPYGKVGWQDEKISLLGTIQRDADGVPLSNPAFHVASASFTALVAFNLSELAETTGAIGLDAVSELADSVKARWDAASQTWVDAEVSGKAMPALATPVLDALLCVLCDSTPAKFEIICDHLFDPGVYGASFGPAGTSRSHPTYDGNGYWRGSAWPQLTYLLWHGMKRLGRLREAAVLASQLRQGVHMSGFAEHWNPQNANPGGAVPQSWSALCAAVR